MQSHDPDEIVPILELRNIANIASILKVIAIDEENVQKLEYCGTRSLLWLVAVHLPYVQQKEDNQQYEQQNMKYA